MNQLYILLGSNQQNPQKQLQLAQKLIEKKLGHIIRQSAVYLTKAWGNTQQPDFLNQVIIVHTNAAAEKSMQIILLIEKEMGRIRTKKNAPRLIDIDILFFNKEIINNKSLQVPHPRIQYRNFVLVPLNELSPQFKHPVLNKTIHQLLKICTDDLTVNKI
jgi:2-amino-4-hydroxy-6-hydroxymethyldihydropteridine diphosphokinase